MQILYVHNYYQQPGGEDQVFAIEADLLRAKGHTVEQYTIHNDQVKSMSALAVAGATLWSSKSYCELRLLIQKKCFDIVHFHNTFPLISPAAYYAVKKEGIPIIQTLHNYRLLCANAEFFRHGKPCENCMGKKIPLDALVHACYRHSHLASAGVVAMLSFHNAKKTWNIIDRYIALTEFARRKFIEGGLTPEKIVVKPNFIEPDPGIGQGDGKYALFVGRLAREKGIGTLIQAWDTLKLSNLIPLKIVGDGPLAPQVINAAKGNQRIDYLGRKPLEDVIELMKKATFLVFPSEWYEGLPRTIIEAFAVGTPVIASNLGSMSTLITSGVNGIHFQVANPEDLKKQVEEVLHYPETLNQMRKNARVTFEKEYAAEKNYQTLIKIYQSAITSHTVKLPVSLPV